MQFKARVAGNTKRLLVELPAPSILLSRPLQRGKRPREAAVVVMVARWVCGI